MKKQLFLCGIWMFCTYSLIAQSRPAITVTAPSWNNMYAWIWNTTDEYDNRFIPMQKIGDSTWSLAIDIDFASHKDSGILFVDKASWETDYQKTTDQKLLRGCYFIPAKYKNRNIIQAPSGTVYRMILYDCKITDCE